MRIMLDNLKLKEGNGWLYRLFLNDEIVYIGITVSLHPMGRISAHYKDKEFDSFEAEQYSIDVLPQVEIDEIKRHTPKYNIAGVKSPAIKQWIFGAEYTHIKKASNGNIRRANIEQKRNAVHIEESRTYKRLEAFQYCCLLLKKKGFALSPKQRESIYNKLPRWVWVENGLYLDLDLDEFVLSMVSGKIKI